ncbi:lasso peptide biosynthesis B2 protein, partial [Saccharothrix sp. MB29]|nr:lasso peptide biosynthesis B2 protein [Saccharothrix sp. MB29]
ARTARPSTYAEARLARHTVLTVSTRCCGDNACLPRSLATALLCRTRGHWPTWCAGVVAAPPFTAHAWVEAEGRMVDEFVDGTTFTALMSVGAPTR